MCLLSTGPGVRVPSGAERSSVVMIETFSRFPITQKGRHQAAFFMPVSISVKAARTSVSSAKFAFLPDETLVSVTKFYPQSLIQYAALTVYDVYVTVF